MIVDQRHAANDPDHRSYRQHVAKITREEWQIVQDFRKCSPTDQSEILRTLTREVMLDRSANERQQHGEQRSGVKTACAAQLQTMLKAFIRKELGGSTAMPKLFLVNSQEIRKATDAVEK